MPPFLLMACRSFLAGGILYLWSRFKGAESPNPSNWMAAALVGAFLFLGGHGALSWSARIIPSGVAAIIMATIPLWMILIENALSPHKILTVRVIFGLILGMAAVVILTEPSTFEDSSLNPLGIFLVLTASLCWAIGSVYSRRISLPENAALSAGMSLLCGGVFLLAVSLVNSEPIYFSSFSMKSLFSFCYLFVVGSVVAFSTYLWLLKTESVTRVGTYAFVNPVVAVFLGCFLGGEQIGPRILLAVLMMVVSVAIVVTQKPCFPRTREEKNNNLNIILSFTKKKKTPKKERL
jgi:drug/metabolite transporter (DMT)-like permease